MSNNHWTVGRYLNWVATRGPAENWKYEDCVAADNLIKEESLETFDKWLNKNVASKPLREWAWAVASAHFGSMDVDNLFMALDIYPEWMDRP